MAWWSKKKSIPVKKSKKPNVWAGQDLIDDEKKWGKSDLDGEGYDGDDDDPLMDLAERIELVAKDSQLRLKDVESLLKDVVKLIPTIAEFKEEIKVLRAEVLEEKAYNRHLIDKLIDKPAPVSAASQLLAARAVEAAKTGSNNTAGPKGKLP